MAMASCLMVFGRRCERETMQMLSIHLLDWMRDGDLRSSPPKQEQTNEARLLLLTGWIHKTKLLQHNRRQNLSQNIYIFFKKVRSRMDSGHHQIRVSAAISNPSQEESPPARIHIRLGRVCTKSSAHVRRRPHAVVGGGRDMVSKSAAGGRAGGPATVPCEPTRTPRSSCRRSHAAR